jgi:hypothetical protein
MATPRDVRRTMAAVESRTTGRHSPTEIGSCRDCRPRAQDARATMPPSPFTCCHLSDRPSTSCRHVVSDLPSARDETGTQTRRPALFDVSQRRVHRSATRGHAARQLDDSSILNVQRSTFWNPRSCDRPRRIRSGAVRRCAGSAAHPRNTTESTTSGGD